MSKDGDWSESYIVNLFDWHLAEQEQIPGLTGTAAWIFKDFATPLRPENPIPRVNQKGVVTRDGTPKESYYVFQSYWADGPMIHILGHGWHTRWGAAGESGEIDSGFGVACAFEYTTRPRLKREDMTRPIELLGRYLRVG